MTQLCDKVSIKVVSTNDREVRQTHFTFQYGLIHKRNSVKTK